MILRDLRDKHGYTQIEVSKRLNVSIATIVRWENSSVAPPTERMIELAILYNTSINYLIGEPLEEILSIDNLTLVQQQVIQAIANDFRKSKKMSGKRNNERYTMEQQHIINSLLQAFNSGGSYD